MPAPRFHPLTRLFFCALGIIGVSVWLGLMLLVISTLSTPWTGRAPEAQLLDLATRFALPLTALSYPASLAWIWVCRTQFDKRSFVSLGVRARRATPDFGRGALVGTLAIAVLAAILWLTGAVSVAGWSSEALKMGAARAVLSLLGYAILFFAVGFFEEILFRGYALHNGFHWLGWRGAVALQAIAFALVHLGNVDWSSQAARLAALGALPSLFLIAIFFALCYRKTGSLWFPIGFHFAWNFCLGCVFSLPVSGIETFQLLDVDENARNWLSGGAFGAEGSWLLMPILLALIYYVSRAPDHPQALLDLELMNRQEEIAAPTAPAPEMEVEAKEEPRENRYGTKFGTSQGFSADTLRELRDLQEARESEQAQAREAARLDAVARIEVAPVEAKIQPLDIALFPVTEPAVGPAVESVRVETAAPSPEIEAKTPEVEVAAPEKAPVVSEPGKKKPPAPRW